jgi:hypothetical protein
MDRVTHLVSLAGSSGDRFYIKSSMDSTSCSWPYVTACGDEFSLGSVLLPSLLPQEWFSWCNPGDETVAFGCDIQNAQEMDIRHPEIWKDFPFCQWQAVRAFEIMESLHCLFVGTDKSPALVSQFWYCLSDLCFPVLYFSCWSPSCSIRWIPRGFDTLDGLRSRLNSHFDDLAKSVFNCGVVICEF